MSTSPVWEKMGNSFCCAWPPELPLPWWLRAWRCRRVCERPPEMVEEARGGAGGAEPATEGVGRSEKDGAREWWWETIDAVLLYCAIARMLRSMPALLLVLVDGIIFRVPLQAHSLSLASLAQSRGVVVRLVASAVAFNSKTCVTAASRGWSCRSTRPAWLRMRCSGRGRGRVHFRGLSSDLTTATQGRELALDAAICKPSASRPPITVPAAPRFETCT